MEARRLEDIIGSGGTGIEDIEAALKGMNAHDIAAAIVSARLDKRRIYAELGEIAVAHGQEIKGYSDLIHGLNNTIVLITGNLELALRKIPDDSSALPYIKRAINAAYDLSSRLNAALTLGRIDRNYSPIKMRLNTVSLGYAFEIRQSASGLSFPIAVKTSPNADGSIFGDPKQISDMIRELGKNAMDAMPEGGTLEIGTEDYATEGFEGSHSAVPKGKGVRLYISDTGAGIKPGDLPKVLERGFTTKPIGKGSGLGLAIAVKIAEKHGAAINVDSSEGKGTTFSVYFPAAK